MPSKNNGMIHNIIIMMIGRQKEHHEAKGNNNNFTNINSGNNIVKKIFI